MSTATVTYPATPQHLDESVIQPSSAFKQEVFRVLGAIVFFIIVYIVLMAAALALAALCAVGGFLLVVNFPRLITIMIGLGLIGLGALVVYFLLKFLFKSNKVDRSHLVEIREADQPELFAFVRTLTKETQTQFPKKIYLSTEVNASVFYDSSFWSMFFPVKKNLQIGLALVNSVNVSEFKAILAHEFGHFSQRSMKLGSYVYNLNQIIYNMLYDNQGYGQTVQEFAKLNSYFAFFAALTVSIVEGIQWVLQKVYGVINKSYMSLSRQMEFHADAVAAYVTGSDHLITSLRRLELADSAYNRLFEYYGLWIKQNLKPDNLYPQHHAMMIYFAEENGINVKDGLPQVDAHTFAQYNKTRVVVKDQWASHPSTDDREKHLRSLNIHTEPVTTSAWSVFRDSERLQQHLTEKVYTAVTFPQTPQTLDFTSFKQRYHTEATKYKLPATYKGFFNFRNITKIDLRRLEERHQGAPAEALFSESVVTLPYVIDGLKADLNTLDHISKGTLPVKNFEFNGEKYKKQDASTVAQQLTQELALAEEQLQKADTDIIVGFLNAAKNFGAHERLRENYSELFLVTDSAEADAQKYNDIMHVISPIYHQALEFDKIRNIMHAVSLQEVTIKDRLMEIINDDQFKPHLTDDERKKIEEYVNNQYVYFREPNFDNNALAVFSEAMTIFNQAVAERAFNIKKQVLEMQLQYMKQSTDA